MTLRRTLILVGLLTAVGSIVHALVRLPAVGAPRLWVDRVNLVAGDGALLLLGLLILFLGLRVRRTLAGQARYLFTRRPVATAISTGLVLAVVLLVALEQTLELVESRRPHPEEVHRGTFTTDFFVDDPVLGYGPAHGCSVTSIKEIDGVCVYDVVYTVDEEGRRVTPPPDRPAGPLVLFFGGSNTFGEGVEDDETLPSRFAALAPSATVYNYGFCGYGPQQTLAMIQDGRLDDVVRGRDVIAVYLFIDAHVARAVGSLIVTTSWGIDMPYYVRTNGGDLERHGSFRTGRSWRNWAYALLARYRTFTVLGHDLPPTRDSDFALTALILEQAAKELASRSSSLRFHVALHPHVVTRDRLVPCFRGSQIGVLDYVGLYGRDDPAYMIPGDWHPTPLAYRTIAAAIARDIGLAEDRGSEGS